MVSKSGSVVDKSHYVWPLICYGADDVAFGC